MWLDERKTLSWFHAKGACGTVSIWESFSPGQFWDHECTQTAVKLIS